MAHTNVSSCVASIIGAFANSLDVFKRLSEKRGRRRHAKAARQVTDEEELRLTRSLRQGPEDIGREYQRNIFTVGEQFAVGDATAQTSLAEVLLTLNTGLVTIITSFLRRDKRDAQLDCQSLTTLSEQSRIATCRTLRQLFRRMNRLQKKKSCPPSGLLSQCREARHEETSDALQPQRKHNQAERHRTRIRGPMLARVIIQDSAKPPLIAMVKPGDGRKKKPSSSGVYSRVDSAVHLVASTTSLPPYSAIEKPSGSLRPTTDRSDTIPEHVLPRGKKSMVALFEPETARPSRSTLRVHATQSGQLESPPLVPVRARVPATELRKVKEHAEKHYSFVSASTKLGEIPLHKWPEPFDFDAMSLMNRDAEKNGWPGNRRAGDDQAKKKGFGFFKLFRRKTEVV